VPAARASSQSQNNGPQVSPIAGTVAFAMTVSTRRSRARLATACPLLALEERGDVDRNRPSLG